MTCVEVLQGGCYMENPPTPQCPVADRSDDVGESVRNDIGLDGEWKHQRLCEGTPGCKPIGTGKFSVQNLTRFVSSRSMIG